MGLLNYTTTIDPGKTVGEMSEMLVKAGATTVNTEYAAGKPVALAFTIQTPHGERRYVLPGGQAEPVLKLLKESGVRAKSKGWRADLPQAERVAWRILKDWLEAQLALIETAMVELDQVMLPYMVTDAAGTTVYELYQGNAMKALQA